MRRVLVVLLALAACPGKKSAPSPEPARFAIVPDQVVSQLGEIGFALAIDLERLDLMRVSSMIPDQLGCMRELVRDAKLAVFTQGVGDKWEGRLTGLTEVGSRACFQAIAKVFEIGLVREPDGSTTADVRGNAISLVWHGNELVITQKGTRQRFGDPPGVILDLLTHVPHDAKAWIVASGFANYKIKSTIAWLATTDSTWTFTVLAEATELDAARPWVESIVHAFRAAVEAKSVAVDDKWFVIDSSAPMSAKLVATIPLGALR